MFEDVPEQYKNLGGRGLTSAIVTNEVEPTCNPIGPNNKLVLAPGLLGGTNCPNSNRLSVGYKSPLTGGIKESNSGGQVGGHLAYMGIKAIIIEGLSSDGEWLQLLISRGRAKLVPSSVNGLNNYEAVARLTEQYGPNHSFITIGRAGEFRLTAAGIAITDVELRPTRQAGRGGVGAVMGSKGLKAIIINPGHRVQSPDLANKTAFNSASKRFTKALLGHRVSGHDLPSYGTASLMETLNQAGGLPSYNFTAGNFQGVEKISGKMLNRLTTERGGDGVVSRACMKGCIIRCAGVYPDKDGPSCCPDGIL